MYLIKFHRASTGEFRYFNCYLNNNQSQTEAVNLEKVNTASLGGVVLKKKDSQKEGDYYIHEEKAPKGYSLLKEPVKVTIIASKNGHGDYTGARQISITNGNEAGSVINYINMKDNNVLFNVKIKNYKGISLPGTGGIGTEGFTKMTIIILTALGLLIYPSFSNYVNNKFAVSKISEYNQKVHNADNSDIQDLLNKA